MSEKRSRVPWLMFGAVSFLSVIGLYVGAYLGLGDYSTLGSSRGVHRDYQSREIAMAFTPLATIEAILRRETVCLGMPGPDEHSGAMMCFDP